MHTVHVGVGGDDDFVIAQAVEPVFDVECGLQEVKFLVLVDHFFRQSVGVEGLAAEGEDGLRVDIAALRDASGGRVTLGDKNARVEALIHHFVLPALGLGRRIVEMHVAVAELFVVEVGLFGAFAGKFRHAGDGFALFLALLNLLLHHFRHVEVLVEVVVHLFLDEVADKLVDAHAAQRERLAVFVLVGRHGERTEFDFRLRFEHRLNHTHSDGRHQSVAHVLHVVVLAEILLDGARDVLFEGTLVRSALRGVLSIDKRVVFLAILPGVGEGDVDVFAFEVDDGVKPLRGHVVGEEIFQTVAGDDAAAVVENGQARVEIRVVAEHRFDELRVKSVIEEESRIGLEENVRAVLFFRLAAAVVDEFSAFEGGFSELSVAAGAGHKAAREGIDSFQTHPVQSDRGCVLIVVVLTAGVQLRNGGNQTTEGNAAAVVADRSREFVRDFDFDFLTETLVELVDRVVDALFEQHINTIFGMRSVAEASDIHTGAHANVGHVVEVANGVFAVVGGIAGVDVENFVGHGERLWGERKREETIAVPGAGMLIQGQGGESLGLSVPVRVGRVRQASIGFW